MKKPNIIFFLSDDLSYRDVGCYGQKYIATPNLDAMAKEGKLFTDAYASAPICGPSRCGILTGKHAGHARIREHGQSVKGGSYQEILKKEDYTIGDVLKSAGYATACIGKWAVGIEGSDAIPNNKGFDYSFGFYDQGYAHTFYPEYVFEDGKTYVLPGNKGFDMTKRYRYNAARYDKKTADDNVYDADGNVVIAELADSKKAQNTYELCEEKAIAFIKANKDKPFFLYYAVQNPHGPLIVPSIAKYKDAPFPSQRHKEWASIVTRLDDGVGRITDLVKEFGLEEDTVFIFASDNGYSAWGYFGLSSKDEVPFFEHKGNMRGTKFSLDGEAGIRVPFVVKWKGKIAENTTSDQPFAMYDLLATFAELAGVDSPTDTDGISLVPLWTDKAYEGHDFLYWERDREQAVRLGDYKAYRASGKAKVKLFNLKDDPKEEHDLSRSHKEIVAKAKEIFKREHIKSDIFISPFETPFSHRRRLKKLNLKPNSTRADSPERAEWLKTHE